MLLEVSGLLLLDFWFFGKNAERMVVVDKDCCKLEGLTVTAKEERDREAGAICFFIPFFLRSIIVTVFNASTVIFVQSTEDFASFKREGWVKRLETKSVFCPIL